MALLKLTSIRVTVLRKKTRLPDCQGKCHFPNLLEFGCIGPGEVENNKDSHLNAPSEHTVNECEQESACWCEYLVIYNLANCIYICVFLIVQQKKLAYLLGMYIVHMILMKLEY